MSRMDLSLQLSQKLKMEQRLMPQLIQSMEVLQMPLMELRSMIDKQLQENPVLEMSGSGGLETPVTDMSPDTEKEEALKELQKLDEEWREYFYPGAYRGRGGTADEEGLDMMDTVTAPPQSLQDYLAQQVHIMNLDERRMRLAEEIIYSLDDRGYLCYPLRSIIEDMDGGYTLREALDVLEIVRGAGPPGVAAHDLVECLLMQLEVPGEEFVLEKLIITFHLEDVVENRIPLIAKCTGRSIEEVKNAISTISHLKPVPAEGWSAQHAHYVVPDMVVKEVDGRYEVALQDSFIPSIRISPYYRELLESGKVDPETVKYIRKKIAAANWLVSAMEQRRDTLQRIGNEIVRVQKDFFEKGPAGLKPLRMQDVADAVGVHVATVSRAVADKYIDTPRGIFPLKFFFTGGVGTSDGSVKSRRGVEEEIRSLIESEDRRHPLSDGEIVKRLKAKGIDIARRTVAKYRQQMGIPSSSKRKEH